jgi:fructose-1,6-bisphosphatase II
MTESFEERAFALAKVTEAAALASISFAGRRDGDAADRAAARAIRGALASFGARVRTVIGEGEKDGVEHVAAGEVFGQGDATVDLAVDPIDGTTRLSAGRRGSVSAAAIAPERGFFDPGPSHYMTKVVCSAGAGAHVDPNAPAADIVRAVARALGKAVADVNVFVLDKPRHVELIQEILGAGARVQVEDAGDLEGAVLAALPDSGVDVLLGTGGSPEGVVSACAVRALGGFFYGKLSPQRAPEEQKLRALGLFPGRFLTLEELVPSTSTAFALTGITDGALTRGVTSTPASLETETLVVWGPGKGLAWLRRRHAG